SVVSQLQLHVRGSGAAPSTGLRQIEPLAGPPKVTSTLFTPEPGSLAEPVIETVPATGPIGAGSITAVGLLRSTFTWSVSLVLATSTEPPVGSVPSAVMAKLAVALLPALSIEVACRPATLAAPDVQVYTKSYGLPVVSGPPGGVNSVPAPSASG